MKCPRVTGSPQELPQRCWPRILSLRFLLEKADAKGRLGHAGMAGCGHCLQGMSTASNSFTGKARSIIARCAIWAQPILNHLDAKVVALRPPSAHLAPGLEYLRCSRLRDALSRATVADLSIGAARKILADIRDISRHTRPRP